MLSARFAAGASEKARKTCHHLLFEISVPQEFDIEQRI